jgi:hypothetical protein
MVSGMYFLYGAPLEIIIAGVMLYQYAFIFLLYTFVRLIGGST